MKALPIGWKRAVLRDIVSETFKNGYSPNCPDEANGSWILSLGNMTDSGFDPVKAKPAPQNDAKVKDFILKSGDFLISRSNTLKKVGRVIQFKGELENCSYPDLMIKFRIDSDGIYNDYIEIFLRSTLVRRYIEGCASGTSNSMVKINKQVIKKIPLILPPLPEQKAIADLISTWDEAIEKTEKLIEAKEKLLKAIAVKMFDRKVIGKNRDWRNVKLNSIVMEHRERSTGSEDVYSVSVSKGFVNQVEHLGRSFAADNTGHYNLVHHGDIAYTKSPTGDFPFGIVKQSYIEENVIVSPLYGIFSPYSFELGVIVSFYFESPVRARNYLYPIIQKGAKNTINITNRVFLSGRINLPMEEAEQKMLATFIMTAKEEIKQLTRISAKYRDQKRGLMQKLLTGKWRMKQDDCSTS